MTHRRFRFDRGTSINWRTGWLAFLFALLGLQAPHTLAANERAEDEVLAIVDRLFDGMREKDEAMLRSVFSDEARLGTTEVDTFIANVLASERHLDEVTFDETVLIDGDLAMAWTPYNIFVDREFHHCGVDLFVMRRGEDGWKITQLDDTRRTDNCDPERRS